MAQFLTSELLYLIAYALKCPGKIKYTGNIDIPCYDYSIFFRGNNILLSVYPDNDLPTKPILINREFIDRDQIFKIPDHDIRILLREVLKYFNILDKEDPVNVEALTNIIFSKHNSDIIELNPKLFGAELTPIDLIEETTQLQEEDIPSNFRMFARKIMANLYNNDILEYRDFYDSAKELLLSKVGEENILLVDTVCALLGKYDCDNTFFEIGDDHYLLIYSDFVAIDNADKEIWRIDIAYEPPFKRAELVFNSWKETGMHLINSLRTVIDFDDKLDKIVQLTKLVSDVDKFARF